MTLSTSIVVYNTQDRPQEKGVYACRVPANIPGFYDDIFLTWVDGQWQHRGSDQRYRGEVTGWIGPLQRKMNQ